MEPFDTAPALHLALATAAVMGFRHGFDYDHVAAISDIAAAEPKAGRAMRLGMVYAGGHAAVVALLGCAALAFQLRLPARADGYAENIVGLTLVLLGVYVIGTLLFASRDTRPKSRAAILGSAAWWLYSRIRRVLGAPPVEIRDTTGTGFGSAFAIGAVHGVGAETPTQVMIFLLAANLGGIGKGLLGLGIFLAGLVTMNFVICASATGLLSASSDRPRLHRILSGAAAAFSLMLGVWYLAP